MAVAIWNADRVGDTDAPRTIGWEHQDKIEERIFEIIEIAFGLFNALQRADNGGRMVIEIERGAG